MNISTLSNDDIVRIKSNFWYETKDGLNCKKTLKRTKNAKATDIRHSCSKAGRVIFESDGLKFTKCLCNFQYPLMGSLMIMHKHYEKGIMPYSGSLMEQPANIIDALEIIDVLMLEMKDEQRKAQEKKHGPGRHRPATPKPSGNRSAPPVR